MFVEDDAIEPTSSRGAKPSVAPLELRRYWSCRFYKHAAPLELVGTFGR
jgi:hypothetical protein